MATIKTLTAKLFTEANRGLLLDLLVFVLNLFLMRLLTQFFIDLFQNVSADEPLAKLIISLACVGMWILPAAGSVLKRWPLHQRRTKTGNQNVLDSNFGCLFNPIFYFCFNLVLMSAILTGLGDLFFGRALLNNGALMVPLIIAGLLLTIVQTVLTYQYFFPPKKPPRHPFLRTQQSEFIGDICLFLNMILYQVLWNLLTFADLGRPSGILEFGGRLFFLCFVALLVYFPPRMFFLAEDIHRRSTWLTMLLANAPVIIRILIGTNKTAAWD
jgi:hypothetical protein